MLVLITDTGRVEQRVVELPAAVDRRRWSSTCAPRSTPGCATGGWPRRPTSSPTCRRHVAPALRGLLATLTSVLLEALVEQPSERVVLGGSANLTEHALDFPAIRPVLEALEEQVVLLRLLDQR